MIRRRRERWRGFRMFESVSAAVRAYRQASNSKPTQKLSETPTLYHVNVVPTDRFWSFQKSVRNGGSMCPSVGLTPPVIASNLVRVLENATVADFALLTSAMHMAWLRYVGGRLKSDYRYSIGLVYNTFPMPPEKPDLSKLEPLAKTILDARAAHPDATLADLYDPDLMPPDLRKAHQALDRAVDKLYRRTGFASERERVEHLFMLYEKMSAPLKAAMQGETKTTPRAAKSDRFGVVTVVHCITNCRSGVDDERSSCGRTALPH